MILSAIEMRRNGACHAVVVRQIQRTAFADFAVKRLLVSAKQCVCESVENTIE
jgi:hypothetical protein